MVVVILFALLSRCDRDDCSQVRQTFGPASTEYQQCAGQRATGGVPRTGGGLFGGYSKRWRRPQVTCVKPRQKTRRRP